MRAASSLLMSLIIGTSACATSPPPLTGLSGSTETVLPTGSSLRSDATMSPMLGRFQLVGVPNQQPSLFLIDTATGCMWHQVQNPDAKRTTFIEVDVENLHWSWGSGAQQILATRIDSSNLEAQQKRVLKENIKKTACGLSDVVLTPTGTKEQPVSPAQPPPASEQPPPSSSP